MLDSLYRNDVWVTTTIFLWLSAVLVVANLLADIRSASSIRASASRRHMSAILDDRSAPNVLDVEAVEVPSAPPDGEPPAHRQPTR